MPFTPPWFPTTRTSPFATKLTVPPNHHLHCRIILWSFFTKYSIQKLNLFSKMEIIKTAWINHCLTCFCLQLLTFIIQESFISKMLVMWLINVWWERLCCGKWSKVDIMGHPIDWQKNLHSFTNTWKGRNCLYRVYYKQFFRFVIWQKYSILNWVLKLNLEKMLLCK